MLNFLFRLTQHRNFVLILSVVVGMILGDYVGAFASWSLYVLAAIMIVTTTSFSFRQWLPLNKALKPILFATFLNYIVFSLLIILLAYWLMPTKDLWIGFVIIGAAPPGVAIVPFTSIMKGDTNYSISGVFGAHLTAIFIAPLLLFVFLGDSLVSPFKIVILLAELVIIPLIISRFLRHPKTLPFFEKYRGKITNWGFFFVITPIIGLNRNVFFTDPLILLNTALVLFIGMFVLAFVYQKIMQKTSMQAPIIISSSLLLTIKGSSFSAVTAFTFFGAKSALPSAVLSVFVVVYIILFSYLNKRIIA